MTRWWWFTYIRVPCSMYSVPIIPATAWWHFYPSSSTSKISGFATKQNFMRKNGPRGKNVPECKTLPPFFPVVCIASSPLHFQEIFLSIFFFPFSDVPVSAGGKCTIWVHGIKQYIPYTGNNVLVLARTRWQITNMFYEFYEFFSYSTHP